MIPSRQPGGERNRQLIYGRHTVAEACKNPARRVLALWITRNMAGRLEAEIAQSGVEAEIVTPQALARMTGQQAVHQGVAAHVAPLTPPTLESLRPPGMVVALDQVSDPHNIGAVLRCCAAFGVKALLVTRRHAPPVTAVLAKAASGALEHVPLLRVNNLARAIAVLARQGFMSLGFDSAAPGLLASVPPLSGALLVFGAEGPGLRRLTRESCDFLVRLDLRGPLRTVNVSNAAALALGALQSGRPHAGDSDGGVSEDAGF